MRQQRIGFAGARRNRSDLSYMTSPDPGSSGRPIRIRSRWTSSAATRPRLSQVPVSLPDLFRRLFRERGLEIVAADTTLREPRPDVAHHECGERRCRKLQIFVGLKEFRGLEGMLSGTEARVRKARNRKAGRIGPYVKAAVGMIVGWIAVVLLKLTRLFDRRLIDQVRENPKSTIFFVAHLANWEISALVPPHFGFDSYVLYRRSSIAAINKASSNSAPAAWALSFRPISMRRSGSPRRSKTVRASECWSINTSTRTSGEAGAEASM